MQEVKKKQEKKPKKPAGERSREQPLRGPTGQQEAATTIKAPPLVAKQRVLYTQSDGAVRDARIVAVHPGSGPDDPEPYFTVSLEDGTERDTVAARLRPIAGGEPAAAARALAPPPPADGLEQKRGREAPHPSDDEEVGGALPERRVP